MTKDYQDFQHLDNDNDHHQLRRGPPPTPRLLQRLCSGSRLLLLSSSLSILLLVVVCVITSQNSQLREDLLALRQNFSNLTVSTEDQVKARSSGDNNHGKDWGLTAVEMGLLRTEALGGKNEAAKPLKELGFGQKEQKEKEKEKAPGFF